MTVSVLLYAKARELAGEQQISVALEEPATVSKLREAIVDQCPELSSLLPHAMFAVDAEYAQDSATILPSSTVALIPPVSGG